MSEEHSKPNIRAIIGLGNPGMRYYKTRHSIGFRIVDVLAQEYGADWKSDEIMERMQIEKNIWLIKPLTFMNASGKVIPFLLKKGIKSEEILVVHDELEKKFGQVIFKFSGSARGHNGLKSIQGMIGQDFWHLRFGIGRPESREPDDVAGYALSPFLPDEEETLSERVFNAIEVIKTHIF